jgi:hypothetical protein
MTAKATLSPYGREGRDIVARRLVDTEHAILFRAFGRDIKRQPTGIHAKVSIEIDGVRLAWGTFNVDKDEERVRLRNSAYAHLNGLSTVYSKEFLKHDLDLFCEGLWEEHNLQFEAESMAGSEQPSAPAFLLDPFILRGGGTIVFAPPGRGKSYVLMLMAVSVDAGLSSLWWTEQTPVLFINLERDRELVKNRLSNVNAVLGLPRTRPLLTINARGRSLFDVIAAADRAIERYGAGLVLLDSISRAGYGDLNANEKVNGIIDGLNSICRSWLALAHTPRGDETHLYGGIHFEAGADVIVRLNSQQDDDGPLGVGLEITKQNDLGKRAAWIRALEFDETGLQRVRVARDNEFPDVEQGREMSGKQRLRQHIADLGVDDATHAAGVLRLDRGNVSRWLNDERVYAKGDKVGREQRYVLRSAVGQRADLPF